MMYGEHEGSRRSAAAKCAAAGSDGGIGGGNWPMKKGQGMLGLRRRMRCVNPVSICLNGVIFSRGGLLLFPGGGPSG